jgi:hypothetical protein
MRRIASSRSLVESRIARETDITYDRGVMLLAIG